MTDVAYFGQDYAPPADWCESCAMPRTDCGHMADCPHGLPAHASCRDCDEQPTPDVGDDTEPPERPVFVDVAALLAGGLPEPPKPLSVVRNDGCGLFYAGQVNVLFGDPECGKSWLAYAAVAETLEHGGRALIVDADHNGAAQVLARLLALGVPVAVLGNPARFRLAEPEDGQHLREAVAEAEQWQPTVAVVDSVGEVLPLLGLNSNSPDDYTVANRRVLRPLARSGAVVLAVDHLPKSPDSRAAGATGTAAKRRTVGGLSLRVTLREPFAPGRGGTASLTVHKDRPGGVRATSPVVGKGEQPAGLFVLTPTAAGLRWHVTAPRAEDVADDSNGSTWHVSPADIAEVDALPEADRASVRRVKDALGWGSDKASATLRAWREGQ